MVLDGDRWGAADDVADRDVILAGINRACRSAIAGYKKPVAVHRIPEIPRNAAGKTDRKALRHLLSGLSGLSDPYGTPDPTDPSGREEH